MKLSILFLVNAVIAGLFGLAFLLMPIGLMSYYGITMTPENAIIARLFGSALLGYSILSLMSKDASDSEALKAVVMALFVSDLIGTLVALRAQLGGMVNNLGWTTVAIYALLAVGFGMHAFKKEK